VEYIRLAKQHFSCLQQIAALVVTDDHLSTIYIDHFPKVVRLSGEEKILWKIIVGGIDQGGDTEHGGDLV
jgi:hypothetical protein